MFAIIETGGKQYSIEAGCEITIDKIAGAVGDKIALDKILMKDGQVGSPFIEGAKIDAEIVKQARQRKILVFKKKRRKGYKRQGGHHQEVTRIKISEK
jgi:large subunit ribosomal protein L21